MQHLTAHNGTFRYRTAETGKFTEVEVYYSNGRGPSSRGIVIAVRPVEVEEGLYITMPFDCFIFRAVPLARKSDKELLAAAERVDGIVPKIVELFEAGTNHLVDDAIRAIFEPAVVAA